MFDLVPFTVNMQYKTLLMKNASSTLQLSCFCRVLITRISEFQFMCCDAYYVKHTLNSFVDDDYLYSWFVKHKGAQSLHRVVYNLRNYSNDPWLS